MGAKLKVILALLAGAVAGTIGGLVVAERSAEGAHPSISELAGNWTEFHPAWHLGGTFSWRGNNTTVAAGVWWATDGENYLYVAAAGTRSASAAAAEVCRREANLDNTDGVWVMVANEPCSWARHPSLTCSGIRDCPAILATGPPPGGGGSFRPPPR